MPQALDVQLHAADARHVVIRLENRSDAAISVLLSGSPFEADLTQDLFVISQGDTGKLLFRGRLIKRSEPLPEDFLRIEAGQSIEAIIPIGRYYSVPHDGEYQIALKWSAQYLDGNAQLASIKLTSAPVVVSLVPQPAVRTIRSTVVTDCSTAQQSSIQATVSATQTMSNEARDGLNGLSADARRNSPRYTQWFGSYDEARFEVVRNTFERISNVLATETLHFHCSCDEADFFAYVYPSQPFNIYLCPAFWRAPLTGRDSKAGTIIHELTHFPQVNGASDHAYSTATVALAAESPDLAVRNGDSYEYFAENVPRLDMFNRVVFTELVPGAEISGQLTARQSSFYKATGVDFIELISDTGDADLIIYQSAETAVTLCRADAVNAPDRCEVDIADTVYIEVVGFSDASFRLVADVAPVVVVQTVPEPTEPVQPTVPVPDDDSQQGGGGAITLGMLLLIFLGVPGGRRVIRR